MTHQERISQSFDLDLRIERIVDLPTQWSCSHDLLNLPDAIEELINDNWEREHVHPSVVPFMEKFWASETDGDDDLEIFHQLSPDDVCFIAVEFATPVRTYYDHDSYSSGWGYYNTKWIIAESLEKAWELGAEWTKSMHEKSREKCEIKPKEEKKTLN